MKEVDHYIAAFPSEVREILQKIRTLVKKTVPGSVEGFAYQMPSYQLNGKPLVYFAGYKNHIGLYATPSGHSQFSEALSAYKQGKGSVQFPLNAPIPYSLIEKIVAFNANQIRQR